MPNLTLAIDEALLQAARDYARKQGTTVNALVRRLLEESVRPPALCWFDEFEALARRAGGSSHGKRWSRDELYDRPELRK